MTARRADPLVGIITPTYNHARYIGACMRSVQSQSYRLWEQVVIDDGSTDQTSEIVDDLSDDRLVLLQRKHVGIEGLGATYNAGLNQTEAELIALLEGDDTWLPSKLELQVRAFRDPNVVLSWSKGLMINQDGRKLYPLSTVRCKSPTESFSARELAMPLLVSNFICPSSSVVIRRSVLERVGGFVQPAGVPFVDLPTFLLIVLTLSEQERFVYTNRILAFWRRHSAQISRSYRIMASARLKTISSLRNRLDRNTLDRLGMKDEFIEEIEAYYKGRALLASNNFQESLSQFRVCLGSHNPQLRLRGLLGLASHSLRFDYFRIVPTVIRYRIGRLTAKGGS